MKSNECLDRFEPDQLYGWLTRYRDDIAHCGDYPTISPRAREWAEKTCTEIVMLLARKNYDPRTKKPPKFQATAALEVSGQALESVCS
jgi:hypothetical protein